MRILLPFCFLSFSFFSSCGLTTEQCDSDKAIEPSPIVNRANEQEKLWESSKPQSYTMLIEKGCFCNPQWWVTSVEGAESSSFLLTHRTVAPDTEFSSMHNVFDGVRNMAKSKPASMGVTYSDAHFPKSFGAKRSECITDSGVGYDVDLVNFEERMGTTDALTCTEVIKQLPGVWLLQDNNHQSPVTATIETTSTQSVFSFTAHSASGKQMQSISVLTNRHGKVCPIQFEKSPLGAETTALLLTANPKELRMQSMTGEQLYYRRVNESVVP